MASKQAVNAYEEMDLGGSNVIAGVLIQSNNEKMSIYQAMMRGILTQGTALVLLEAQAAVGFIIDPVKNEKVPVRDALAAGLTGGHYYGKLLSAERAVTGYTDPCTGNKISLFQAMKKDLIVKDHGIRLLEAQIATGGIIDPVYSHRVPVEVAYKQGYFDEEMNRILSDPKKHSRSCFDPNTNENLTYMQLLSRCVPDPDTGLYMLHLMDKGSVLFQLDEQARKSLQSAPATVSVGLFRGQNVTVWELLFSRYVPDRKRQELLKKYKAGTLTIQEIITILTTIITETEMGSKNLCTNTEDPSKAVVTSDKAVGVYSHEKHLRKSLKCVTIYVTAGEFQGQKVSLLDLLFSQYIPQEKRQTLLELYRTGILTTDQIITAITSIITKTEVASRKLMKSAKSPKRDERTSKEAVAAHPPQDTQVENILKSTTIDVPLSMFQGQKASVWNLLFSKCIPEEKQQEILELYREGILTLDQVITIVTTIVKKKEATSRKFVINVKTPSKDIKTSEQAKDIHLHEDHQLEKTLKSTMADVPAGEFHDQKASAWDMLFSKYIPEEKRQEILELYREGMLTLDHVITVVTTIVKKKEAASRKSVINVKTPSKDIKTSEQAEDIHLHEDHQLEKTLKSTMVDVPAGEFQNHKASVWDLLFSKYIPEEKRQEILELYREEILTLDQVITVVTTIIKKKEATSRKFVINVKTPSKDIKTSEQAEDIHLHEDHQLEKTLKSTMVDVPAGEFQDHKASVWDLLFSKYIPEEKRLEILELYREEILTLDQVITVVTTIIKKKEATSRKFVINVKTPSKDIKTSEQAEDIHLHEDHQLEKILKSTVVDIPVGEFHEQKASVWNLLFSNYIPKETRQVLLKKYRAGMLTIDKMKMILTTIITHALEECLTPNNQQILNLLQSEASYVTVGQFQDQRVSVQELLSSKCISQYTREAHLDTYNTGRLTINEITITTTVITRPEGKKEDY